MTLIAMYRIISPYVVIFEGHNFRGSFTITKIFLISALYIDDTSEPQKYYCKNSQSCHI